MKCALRMKCPTHMNGWLRPHEKWERSIKKEELPEEFFFMSILIFRFWIQRRRQLYGHLHESRNEVLRPLRLV